MNGLDCFAEGFSLVRKPGLRQYVVIPALINAVVLFVLVGYTSSQFGGWVESLSGWLPDWLSFLDWLIWLLTFIIVFLTLLYVFIFVASIIASPFYALLSVRVEEHLAGKPLTSNLSLWMIVPRAVGREIAKLAYLLPRLLFLLLFSLIPVVNSVAPILWIVFGAWMMAVQFTDYAADNNELSFAQLRSRLKPHRLNALMFGLPTYLLMAIPIVNLVVLPVGVAGATRFWFEHLRASDACVVSRK